MTNSTLTIAQVKAILEFPNLGRGQIHPNSIVTDEYGNVEIEVFETGSLYTSLLGFVIYNQDGEQVANVTPARPGYTVRKWYGTDHAESEVQDDAPGPYEVAKRQAREHAAESAEA